MRFRPVDYDPIFSSDVSFIGTNKSSRRVGILSKIKDAGIQIRVWGEGWEGSGFEPGTPAYLNDFNKVCSSSKIMLNINQSEYWPEYSITFSQKVFMMAAAGSFILTDFIHGLNLFFREYQYATYSDSDLISRIRYFLNHEQERLSTASSVRSSILKSHTYIHRVRDIISCLGL
jgi:spore maturation protein CgeB